MKTGKLLLIFFLTFVYANAQTGTKGESLENYEGLKISFPVKYRLADKDVKYLIIGYFEKKATYITVKLNDTVQMGGFKEDSQYFDLNFEGDAYMLKKSYPWVELPAPIHIITQDLYGKDKNDRYYIKMMSVYPDSTIFYYSRNVELAKDFPSWGFPAKYISNLTFMQDRIADRLKQNKAGHLRDSVCVFELFVTRQGELTYGKLIGGEESMFTKAVYETVFMEINRYFSDGKPKWGPAIVYSSGRPIATKLKLFAKLNKDGSVLITLPRTLGNFTGN